MVVVAFYFDLVPPTYFLKKSLIFNISTSFNLNNLSLDYSEQYVVYSLRGFPLMEYKQLMDKQFECTGVGLQFQTTHG